MELPKAFDLKVRKMLQSDYDNYMSSFKTEYGQTLRVNRLKITPADFIRRFPLFSQIKGSVPWCENGFYYVGEERLSMHPWYYAGVYYLQEPSAMGPASYLPVEPGERVLDLCAAPGGKTTALAAKLAGEGILIANDISASRCKALVKNMEMAGVSNALVVCEEPEKLAKHFPGYFDKILIDAPCSGEGMFRKDSSMMQYWSEEEVVRYSEIQKELLSLGVSMLKPGGMLMYSTCTYSVEEDEESVGSILLEDESMSLLELPLIDGMDHGHPEWSEDPDVQELSILKNCRRFWNHRVDGEGQFMALLSKSMPETGDDISSATKTKPWKLKPVKATEEMLEFFGQIKKPIPVKQLYMVEDRCFLLPEHVPDMRSIRMMKSGLHLGHVKKKRFEPAQALAMALKPEEYKNVLMLSSEDPRTERYLRCETIEGDCDNGWVLVCVDGFPLGWGKANRGMIKNKYTPSWRKL